MVKKRDKKRQRWPISLVRPRLASWFGLYEALVMVRDADNDCRLDGLPMIPSVARAKIDAALAAAEPASGRSLAAPAHPLPD